MNGTNKTKDKSTKHSSQTIIDYLIFILSSLDFIKKKRIQKIKFIINGIFDIFPSLLQEIRRQISPNWFSSHREIQSQHMLMKFDVGDKKMPIELREFICEFIWIKQKLWREKSVLTESVFIPRHLFLSVHQTSRLECILVTLSPNRLLETCRQISLQVHGKQYLNTAKLLKLLARKLFPIGGKHSRLSIGFRLNEIRNNLRFFHREKVWNEFSGEHSTAIALFPVISVYSQCGRRKKRKLPFRANRSIFHVNFRLAIVGKTFSLVIFIIVTQCDEQRVKTKKMTSQLSVSLKHGVN